MIIGITGTLGAGKGTVVEYLMQRGLKHYAVSDDFLAGEAVSRGLTPDRTARRNIANEYRAKNPTALMEAVYARASAQTGDDAHVVIEPQHTKAEVEFIKEKGGIVIAVDADLQIRYERISKRGSAKDNVTYEQFVKEQAKEMASENPDENNLTAAIEAADFYILNNGTISELYEELEAICQKLKV